MKTTKDWIGIELQEEAIEYGWNVSTGYFTKRTWKGTEAEIKALLPSLQAAGYSYTVTQGPIWQVTATIQNDTQDNNDQNEQPIVQFEVSSGTTTGNVLMTQNPLTKDLDPVIVARVKNAIDNNETLAFLAESTVPAAARQKASDLYFHYQHGVQEYYQSNPVLRKTYTVSNRWAVNESIDGVNRIFTKGGMIATENVPSLIHGLLPQASPGEITVGGITYIYGWHFGHPTYTRVGPTSYQVSSEYSYGLWPVKLYLDYYA